MNNNNIERQLIKWFNIYKVYDLYIGLKNKRLFFDFGTFLYNPESKLYSIDMINSKNQYYISVEFKIKKKDGQEKIMEKTITLFPKD